MSAPDATEPVGAGSVLCGRYRLVTLIARGGMASVWEAHDNVLARSVAVKMLHPHLASDQLFLERFRREAVAAARLAHPNVVATFDAGITPQGTAFIVMELVRGRTLSAFESEHRPLPLFVCIEIGMQIAEALAQAHASGLVHRDVKPANVLVCDAESDGVPLVKVTDFGIAKAAEGLGLDLTKTGMVLGTPKYLSPEQIEGREPDARADVYALGVVVFEMVAGIPPFRGPTEMAVAMQHVNDTPVRLRDLRPNVPHALDVLVAQMLAKRPAERPPSAVAVRRALAAIEVRGRQGRPWPPPSAPPSNRPPRPPGDAFDAGSPALARPVGTNSTGVPGTPRTAGGGAGTSGGTFTGAGGRTGAAPGGPPPPPVSRTGSSRREPLAIPPPVRVDSPWPAPPSATGGPGRSRGGTQVGAIDGLGPPVGPTRPRPTPTAPAPGRRPPPRPNWTGRVVLALVVAALLVIVIVLAQQGSKGPSGSTSGSTVPAVPIKIQSVSVFHLERDADNAATASYAIDGNPDTSWATDHYYGPNGPTFAGLRHGLGLAFTLASVETLHHLKVISSTDGWSAQVYVADAIPNPPSLAPWGPVVASQQNITGSTTFNLNGSRGQAILLWITNLGPSAEAAIAEVTAT